MMNKYGLLGRKLSHTLSPQIHDLIFKYTGLTGTYDVFEAEEDNVSEVISSLHEKKYKGINVTIPYKETILTLLDQISPSAKEIGAVNTIHFSENGMINGYNTDYNGFQMMLSHFDIDTRGKSVAVLGTGGASKAICKALIDSNSSSITLVSRSGSLKSYGEKKSNSFFYDLPITDYPSLETGKITVDIIVNCTPSGMFPNVSACPISEKVISKLEAAVDIIYNPACTPFLNYAKNHHVKCCNGLYMLLGQAVHAQEIWNDTLISSEITDKIFHDLTSK